MFQYHNAIFLQGERFRLKKKQRSIWSMAALWRFPRAFDEPVRDIETLVNRSCARADHAQNSLRDRVTVFIRHKLPARNQLRVYYSYLLGIRNSNQQTRTVEKVAIEGRGGIESLSIYKEIYRVYFRCEISRFIKYKRDSSLLVKIILEHSREEFEHATNEWVSYF